MSWDREVDVVVVGSGAAAFMAALSAAKKGASVLVLEKGNEWGGTSSKSGGGIWIPNSRKIAEAGVTDSPEDAFAYMRAVIPESEVDDATIQNYVDYSPKMIDFLEENTELTYTPVPGYADYYPDVKGWKEGGRTMDPSPLDGRQLDEMLYKLVDSPRASKAMSVFSMSILEGVQILAKTPGWQKIFMGIMWGYISDIPGRLKGKRDRRLTQGNSLVAALYLACKAKGVELQMGNGVSKLVQTDGRVSGVVMNDGKKIGATKGVVIAAGGFDHNKEMREQYLPSPATTGNSSGVTTNTGDLINAAQEVGAALGLMHEAWWAPTAITPFGPTVLFSEKSKPGLIIVDKKGKRFMNEAITYNSYGDCFYGAHEKGHDVFPAYCILDSHYRQKYMFGGVVQGEMSPDLMNGAMIGDDKMLVKADTIEELAQKIGVDVSGLKETMGQVKTFSETGVDDEFSRGSDAHDVMYGDPEVTPNACWGPMDKGPYYATKLVLGDLGTKGGLVINHDGQVLNDNGEVIDGLYAAGNSSASIMGSKYPGAGCTLGPAMTIAYKAAHHLMGAPV